MGGWSYRLSATSRKHGTSSSMWPHPPLPLHSGREQLRIELQDNSDLLGIASQVGCLRWVVKDMIETGGGVAVYSLCRIEGFPPVA